jgi:hypothetical protein
VDALGQLRAPGADEEAGQHGLALAHAAHAGQFLLGQHEVRLGDGGQGDVAELAHGVGDLAAGVLDAPGVLGGLAQGFLDGVLDLLDDVPRLQEHEHVLEIGDHQGDRQRGERHVQSHAAAGVHALLQHVAQPVPIDERHHVGEEDQYIERIGQEQVHHSRRVARGGELYDNGHHGDHDREDARHHLQHVEDHVPRHQRVAHEDPVLQEAHARRGAQPQVAQAPQQQQGDGDARRDGDGRKPEQPGLAERSHDGRGRQ